MNIIAQLDRLLSPIRRKIASMIVCALIESVDDSKDIQLVKVSLGKDEVQDGVERVQPFGLTSNPPDKSEAVVVYAGGNRKHGIVVTCDSGKYRIKGLPKGAVAVYNSNGDMIKLTKDRMDLIAKSVHVQANKVSLGNSTTELIDLFDQLLDAINNSIVPTISGPQKLSEVVAGTVLMIKTKLLTLKQDAS